MQNEVENQEGRPVYGWVQSSEGSWDRLRALQPGPLLAWNEERGCWIECRLVPVPDGETIDPLQEGAEEAGLQAAPRRT